MIENKALEDIEDFALGINKEVSNLSLGIAIKALKKQIPIKAETNGYCWFCPECGGDEVVNMEYCPNCGQKLEW